MIPYGADEVLDAPVEPLARLGVEPGRYMSVIARAEPENSLLEIVQGFSAEPRGCKLVVLGNYDEKVPYQRSVLQAASSEVLFPGAIYDKSLVSRCASIRWPTCTGTRSAGTNPSLVEALGAGNAVIAHDNRFNRWVAGPQAAYFRDGASFSRQLESILAEPARLEAMRAASRARHHEAFRWETMLGAYERLLLQYQR